MKTPIIFLMILMLFPILIQATPWVQYSLDNATWINATIIGDSNAIVLGLNANTLYYLRASNDNGTTWTYTEQRTQEGGSLSSFAIMFFVLVVTFGIFALPLFVERFAKNEITNLIIKRAMWCIGIFLMMLNSAIAASISNAAGLGLEKEMFLFMWIFGTAGYLFLGFIVIKTMIDAVSINKENKRNRQMGGEDDE